MTLSIRNTLRSLSALVLTAAFLPGCDGEDYEALGLSAEQIDGMSAEELDELAALEDEDEFDLTAEERPAEPHPHKGPTGITGPHTDGPADPGLSQTFWNPRYTHTAEDAGLADTLWDPHHTHTAEDAGLADTLWDPHHTHAPAGAPLIDGVTNPVRPTHAPVALDLRAQLPEGCQPDQPETVFANG